MQVVAIKFDDGTYYAGCNKNNAKTLLGAQLYVSEQKARTTMEKSINFPWYMKDKLNIVPVRLEEEPYDSNAN